MGGRSYVSILAWYFSLYMYLVWLDDQPLFEK